MARMSALAGAAQRLWLVADDSRRDRTAVKLFLPPLSNVLPAEDVNVNGSCNAHVGSRAGGHGKAGVAASGGAFPINPSVLGCVGKNASTNLTEFGRFSKEKKAVTPTSPGWRKRSPKRTRRWEIALSTHSKKRGAFVETANSRARPGGGHGLHGPGEPAHWGQVLYRLARRAANMMGQARAFVAGFLIGLSVWTPVFFATAAEETEWQRYGIPGGLAMFGAGVWLRVGKSSRPRHESRPRDPAGPSHPSMDRLAA